MLAGNKFIVKWIDDKKVDREKVYDSYADAQKAFKWLLAQGADGVDLAIKKPAKVAQEGLESE